MNEIETPEAHHLRVITVLRQQAVDAAARAKVDRSIRFPVVARRALRKLGCARLAKAVVGTERHTAGWKRDQYVEINCGDVRVEVPVITFDADPVLKALDEVKARQAKLGAALCALNAPGPARRFGSWVRARYGRKPDAATIAKAHVEWIAQQTGCTC